MEGMRKPLFWPLNELFQFLVPNPRENKNSSTRIFFGHHIKIKKILVREKATKLFTRSVPNRYQIVPNAYKIFELNDIC